MVIIRCDRVCIFRLVPKFASSFSITERALPTLKEIEQDFAWELMGIMPKMLSAISLKQPSWTKSDKKSFNSKEALSFVETLATSVRFSLKEIIVGEEASTIYSIKYR